MKKFEMRSDNKMCALKLRDDIEYTSINIMYCLRIEKFYCSNVKCKTFRCFYCKGLTTLIGVPKNVSDVFDCSSCIGLKTLDGIPTKCNTIIATKCEKLKNLNPLLKCDVKKVYADKRLLDDYYRKKEIIDRVGYEDGMKIVYMMDNLKYI